MESYETVANIKPLLNKLSEKLGSLIRNGHYGWNYNLLLLNGDVKMMMNVLGNNGTMYPKTLNRLLYHQSKIEEMMACLDKESQRVGAINKLSKFFRSAKDVLRSEKYNEQYLNTESFLSAEVDRLEKEKEELAKQLAEKKTSEDYSNELDALILESMKRKMEGISGRVEKAKDAIVELKQKEDAQNNLKKRIQSAFNELANGIIPLTNEQERLTILYRIYFWTSIAIFLALISYEVYFVKVKWDGTLKDWFDLAPFYLPVPLIAGLLWAFIHQMNRAQVQLLNISKVLYRIKYIEGLLQAINHLNMDVNETSEKIVSVMNRMIDSFMSQHNSDMELSTDVDKDDSGLQGLADVIKGLKDLKS